MPLEPLADPLRDAVIERQQLSLESSFLRGIMLTTVALPSHRSEPRPSIPVNRNGVQRAPLMCVLAA